LTPQFGQKSLKDLGALFEPGFGRLEIIPVDINASGWFAGCDNIRLIIFPKLHLEQAVKQLGEEVLAFS